MAKPPMLLLEHHLKSLKLLTFLRGYDKQTRICADYGVDHVGYLARLTELELIDRERWPQLERFRSLRSSSVVGVPAGHHAAVHVPDGAGHPSRPSPSNRPRTGRLDRLLRPHRSDVGDRAALAACDHRPGLGLCQEEDAAVKVEVSAVILLRVIEEAPRPPARNCRRLPFGGILELLAVPEMIGQVRHAAREAVVHGNRELSEGVLRQELQRLVFALAELHLGHLDVNAEKRKKKLDAVRVPRQAESIERQRLAWHDAPHSAGCGAVRRASSASSSAIRAVSGAVTARISSSV